MRPQAHALPRSGGAVVAAAGGPSFCPLCGAHAGGDLLTDGVWAWERGLAHQVEVHCVALPEGFVAQARQAGWVALGADVRGLELRGYDLSPWRAWCARYLSERIP